ncbi:MAG TPA: glycosyltransferase family 39 protein [Candidatus Binatia bacterium]|nr:glycosyltransferase family 39 protein [Candidatus Binatia bacterium]
MTDRRLRILAWTGLALVAIAYLGRIGGFVLQDPDEGRYAEIPREMLELGDWITPRLNYVKYFEKPPLLYWLVGASYHAFGMSEWSARLAPALAGIATIALVHRLGLAMFGRRAALVAAALLATTPLFFVLSQVLVIDVLLTACFTATLATLFAAHRAERKGPWCAAAAGAVALGVLAKGLVALVVPGAIGLAFLLWQRDFATVRAFLRPAPIAVFAVIAVPWFAAVSTRNPEFPYVFFVREHIERFATRSVGHPEGPLYYLPIVIAGGLPWTLLVAALAVEKPGRAAARSLPRAPVRLLSLWAGGIVLFFSAASSKLPPYVLPAFPALALLAGAWIDRALDEPVAIRRALISVAWCLAAVGGVVLVGSAIGAVAAPWVGPRFDAEPPEIRALALAAASAGVALFGAGWMVLRARSDASTGGGAAPAQLLVLVLGLGLALFGAIGGRGIAKTTRDLAIAIEREAVPADRPLVVSYRRLMQSLSFYTRGRVTMLDPHATFNEITDSARSSADYGEFFWSDLGRLQAEWSSGRKVFIATDRAMVPELASSLSPAPRVLASDGKRVLLVNFPTPGGESARAPAAVHERATGS